MKGVPFTERASNSFGGDSRNLSKMFDATTDFLYNTFNDEIPGTSLIQWIPSQVHQCWCLINNALSNGALEEDQYIDGEVVNRT